ncbi:hypothetical protein KEM54_003417 [Ascosphaera aggregata]|nr:hypothetical protein KEM54_003417 [Ascosphaera aggregata]
MDDVAAMRTVFPEAVNRQYPPSKGHGLGHAAHLDGNRRGIGKQRDGAIYADASLHAHPAIFSSKSNITTFDGGQQQLRQQEQRRSVLALPRSQSKSSISQRQDARTSMSADGSWPLRSDSTQESTPVGASPEITSTIRPPAVIDSTEKQVKIASPVPLKIEKTDSSPRLSNIRPGSRSSLASSKPPSQSRKRIKPAISIDDTATSRNDTNFVRTQLYAQVRPRSSIPSNISTEEYAQQCIEAAHASRLNPYALHRSEQELLQDHLCHLHVTAYLNIRNGILRAWTRNPMVSVTQQEALGCVRDARWMPLALFAYDWLVRNGYINFGCVEVPRQLTSIPKRGRRKEAPVIVIIGAGMAGLGAARQLHNLFDHHSISTDWKILVLEGRKRIGGRIYSQPLYSKRDSESLPLGCIPTAEAGAHIVVGFDHGNPLDPIIRAQLALRHHLLRDVEILYDIDGKPVDRTTDQMVENLYNDVLERAGAYRRKTVVEKPAEGDHDMIECGRDTLANDGLTIKQYEDAKAYGVEGRLLPLKRNRRGYSHKIGDVKTTSSATLYGFKSTTEQTAAQAARKMGWLLNSDHDEKSSLELDDLAHEPNQNLGAVMDEAIHQYQDLLPLTPQHMRLFNWHYANLEYACGVSLNKLDLAGWDQDMGNEFEGLHAQISGGYQQVPRALWSLPYKLDVETNKVIKEVHYDCTSADGKGTVIYNDGEVIHANKLLITVPLGVLKDQSIKFVPPLPDWKMGAINRLGYGTMNKVILVFEKAFWDVEHDIFGILHDATVKNSLLQSHYSSNRGKFFLIWNCIKTSGLPVLIALMAGDTAYQTEKLSDAVILSEVMTGLRNVFRDVAVPDPAETIVTRWGLDKFSKGTYSHVAAGSLPGDYDLLAKPVGNLYFAGEATCGTHPATVHGAYISGLRAASEIADSVIGPISTPKPLCLPKKGTIPSGVSLTPERLTTSRKRKVAISKDEPGPSDASANYLPIAPATPVKADSISDLYDSAMQEAVRSEIGERPVMSKKLPLNPFLIYQKFYWGKAREAADQLKKEVTGNSEAVASRDEVRVSLGSMWRNEKEEIRKPYLDQIQVHRVENEGMIAEYRRESAEWDCKAAEVRKMWKSENPFDEFEKMIAQVRAQDVAVKELTHRRKSRKAS